MRATELLDALRKGNMDDRLVEIYGERQLEFQRKRYDGAICEYISRYGADSECGLFSVAGRSEISGNHTDHNRGCVLAASVNLDIIAVAGRRDDGLIRVKSYGFKNEDIRQASDPAPDEKLKGSSAALIDGVCRGFLDRGYKIGGFCAYTTSSVLKGSGLSSSAAFEVMIGNILSHLYNDGSVPNTEIAKIAQYSENKFYGKPCGLMDQTACAVGGFVFMDFGGEDAQITALSFNLEQHGYSLCIVNTGENHAQLDDEYAKLPAEMKAVAACFGKSALRYVEEDEFISSIPSLRVKCGDRAVLRALHFFEENRRVQLQRDALLSGDMAEFLRLAGESGTSSFKYLQNVYTNLNVRQQGLSLALCMSERILAGSRFACRVHGGGFAGTVQAYVPTHLCAAYKEQIEEIFGDGSCVVLEVRKHGAVKI